MPDKQIGINGGTGNDKLEVGIEGQTHLQQTQDDVNVQAALVGLVYHDHTEVGDASTGDPVDQRAVGAIDELGVAVSSPLTAMHVPHVAASAQRAAVQIARHEGRYISRGLDARLGDDDLPVAGEQIRRIWGGGHHQPVRHESGLAAAGGANDDRHLMLLNDLDQFQDVLVLDAELDARVGQVKFGRDGNCAVAAVEVGQPTQTTW